MNIIAFFLKQMLFLTENHGSMGRLEEYGGLQWAIKKI